MEELTYSQKYYRLNLERFKEKSYENKVPSVRQLELSKIVDEIGPNVDRETRFKLYKRMGWYLQDGLLYTHMNKTCNHHSAKLRYNGKMYSISTKQLIHYLSTGEIPTRVMKSDVPPKPRVRKPKIKVEKPKFQPKNYILNSDLEYEIIISQGKGVISDKTYSMLYKIATNLSKRFYYKDMDLKHDVMLEAYLHMIQQVNNYNHKKYDNTFAYFSEIAKRGLAFNFNRFYKKNHISINNFY